MRASLPEPPQNYEFIAVRSPPDWRQLEGWRVGGVEIVRFDRLEGDLVGPVDDRTNWVEQFTWADVSTPQGRFDVACDRKMHGVFDAEAAATEPLFEGFSQGISVSSCFADGGVLFLAGRAPWASRAGWWIDETETFQLLVQRTALDNLLAFNPAALVSWLYADEVKDVADTPGAGQPLVDALAPLARRDVGWSAELRLGFRFEL